MLRSLYSGISGLRAHQTLMDVVGNNIANVNTTGYKSSSVEFQDTLSQVVSSAGKASQGTGGVNATEVGLGVKVAGTGTSWTQGAAQLTGKNTDMMISGDGFFVTKSADNTVSYTRDGSFSTDALGQLTSVDGSILQGWTADSSGKVNTAGSVGNLQIPVTGTLGAPAATTKLTLSGNLPLNYSSATPTIGPVAKTVYDTLGKASTIYVQYVHSSADTTGKTWSVQTSTSSTMSGAVSQTITFGADGKPNATSGGAAASDLTTIATNGTPSYILDVTSLTGYAGTADSSGSSAGSATTSTVTISGQDGAAAGAITAFSIGADGTITASFDNGLKKVLGQVALAAFTNPSGLIKSGSSSYTESSNSGTANIGTAGTGGRGATTSGELEMSNVDLSQEFTNLIVAQRGFQANSRIITSSDQLLQTLVQMGQ